MTSAWLAFAMLVLAVAIMMAILISLDQTNLYNTCSDARPRAKRGRPSGKTAPLVARGATIEVRAGSQPDFTGSRASTSCKLGTAQIARAASASANSKESTSGVNSF